MEKKEINIAGKNVVCFDGVCGVCNHYVDFLISLDKHRQINYISLQDERIHPFLIENKINPHDLNTIVFFQDGQPTTKSQAVFNILKTVSFFPFITSFLDLLPVSVADFCYDIVAKNRHLIIKPREHCRIPTPEERDLFL